MSLEHIVFLPGASEALAESGEDPNLFLEKHISGDWGELSDADGAANILALAIGGELFSSYRTSRGVRFKIATEADHSKTFIYLHNGEHGDEAEEDEIGEDGLFGSFTSAVGFALGELLLLAGRPEGLRRCLSLIETVALATLISSKPRRADEPDGRLADAALAAVRAWHEETTDLNALERQSPSFRTCLRQSAYATRRRLPRQSNSCSLFCSRIPGGLFLPG